MPRDVEIGEGRSPRAARETRSGKDDRAGRDGGGGRGGVRNGRLGSAPGRIGSSGHVISATIGLLGDVPREGQSAGWAADWEPPLGKRLLDSLLHGLPPQTAPLTSLK